MNKPESFKLVDQFNPILKRPTRHFDFDNPEFDPVELSDHMIKIMRESNGIGLTANQIGIDLSVIAMGKTDPEILFNPEIVSVSDQQEAVTEGCLSYGDIRVVVRRPREVHARWQNSSGEWIQSNFSLLDARVFLHEFDHILGITMQDRVSQYKWDRAKEKLKKIKR